jgi:hypothetical protein
VRGSGVAQSARTLLIFYFSEIFLDIPAASPHHCADADALDRSLDERMWLKKPFFASNLLISNDHGIENPWKRLGKSLEMFWKRLGGVG